VSLVRAQVGEPYTKNLHHYLMKVFLWLPFSIKRITTILGRVLILNNDDKNEINYRQTRKVAQIISRYW